jgi:hypothetical protein
MVVGEKNQAMGDSEAEVPPSKSQDCGINKRGGSAQLDRNSVFLSDLSAG